MLALASRPANSRFRWVICGMLFFATVIAYIDRGMIGFLEKDLESVIGFTTVEYGGWPRPSKPPTPSDS